MTGTNSQLEDYKFLFGNIDIQTFEQIADYKGFVLGVRGKKIVISVVSDTYKCQGSPRTLSSNKWSHLVFSWNDPALGGRGLQVFKDGNKVSPTRIDCVPSLGDKRLSRQTIILGSSTQQLYFAVEFDNLAIWYKSLQRSRLMDPWEYIRGERYSLFTI